MGKPKLCSWPNGRTIVTGILIAGGRRWQTARLIGGQIVFPPELLTRLTMQKGNFSGATSTPATALCRVLYPMLHSGIVERRINTASGDFEYRIKAHSTEETRKKNRENVSRWRERKKLKTTTVTE